MKQNEGLINPSESNFLLPRAREMSKQDEKQVQAMSEEELCQYLIARYTVDKSVLREMANYKTKLGERVQEEYPDLTLFYEFLLVDSDDFIRQDAINLYDAIPFDEGPEFFAIVTKHVEAPNTQTLIRTCRESTHFLSYLYEALGDIAVVAMPLNDESLLTYREQIETYLLHNEEVYKKEMGIISRLCELGAISLAEIRDEYEMVDQYLAETEDDDV